MPVLHAIILGLTQGLSEFLPISSSGHLLLVPWLLGWDDFPPTAAGRDLEKAFDVALHIGTAVALLAYFRTEIVRLVRAGGRALARRSLADPEGRLAWLLAVSTMPGIVTGAVLDSFITEHLGAAWLIAVMLIVMGLVLALADRVPGSRLVEHVGARDAILIGVAQALALQPGVSRSGATITMARFLRFDRDAAARVSFLMSVPITVGAIVFKVGKLLLVDGGIPDGFAGAFAWGIAASAVSGFAAVAGLLRFIRRRSFSPFVVYRIVLGASVLGLAASSLR